MKKTIFTAFLLGISIIISSSNAQTVVNFGIGPTWPRDLRGTEKPTAWNATIEYYKIFDNIIGFGVDADFSWNIMTEDTLISNDTVTIYKTDNSKKTFMFPISACLVIDPVPNFVFHPVIRGQVGLNLMIKSQKAFDSTGSKIEIPSGQDVGGFYYGVIGKASIDGVYDIGKHAAVFVGFEYQWGRVRKKIKDTENQYFRPPMYGPAIRMGLSVLY